MLRSVHWNSERLSPGQDRMTGGLKWTAALTILFIWTVRVRNLNIGSSNLDNAWLSRSIEMIAETVLKYDIMLLQIHGIGRSVVTGLQNIFQRGNLPFSIAIDRQNNTGARQRSLFVYRRDRVNLVDYCNHETDQPAPPFSITFSPTDQDKKKFTLLAARIRQAHPIEDLQELYTAVSRIQAKYGPDHAIASIGTFHASYCSAAFRQLSSRRLSDTFSPYGVYLFGNMEGAIDPNYGTNKEANWDRGEKIKGNRMITITEFRIDTNRLDTLPNLYATSDPRWSQFGKSTSTQTRASAADHSQTISSNDQHPSSSMASDSYYSQPSTSRFYHSTTPHQTQLTSPGFQPFARTVVRCAAPACGPRMRHAPTSLHSRFVPYMTNAGETPAASYEVASYLIQPSHVQPTDRPKEMPSNVQLHRHLPALYPEMIDRRLDARHRPAQPFTGYRRQHQKPVGDPVVIQAQQVRVEQHGDRNIHEDTRFMTDFSEWAQSQPDSFLTSLLEPDILQTQLPTSANTVTAPPNTSSGYNYQYSLDNVSPPFPSTSQLRIQDPTGEATSDHRYPIFSDLEVQHFQQSAEYVDHAPGFGPMLHRSPLIRSNFYDQINPIQENTEHVLEDEHHTVNDPVPQLRDLRTIHQHTASAPMPDNETWF